MISTILLFLVVAILVICSLINKDIIYKAHPFTIQAIQAGFSVVLFPVFFWLSRKFAPEEHISAGTFSLAALTGLLSTAGFVLFLAALKDKPISIATSYLSIYPSVTLIVCVFLGTEKISLAKVVGMLTIMAGILIVQIFDQ